MAKRYIAIEWDGSREFVQVDIPELLAGEKISTTSEWREYERRVVTYNTDSAIRESSSSGRHQELEITLSYSQKSNEHLGAGGSCWGHTIIRGVSELATKGKAEWFDDHDKDYDGIADWSLLPHKLLRETSVREVYSRIKREQDAFRAALLVCDKKCVITSETMPEVLEAAHIIPAKKFGAEVPGNGILLRSDIHKLYDSGAFKIDCNGKIHLLRDVSRYYQELLEGAQLPSDTVQ